MACFWQDMVAATQVCDLGAPVIPDSITLWGYTNSNVRLRTNSTQGMDLANVEVIGAASVSLVGFWPDEYSYTNSPTAPVDPVPVTVGDYGAFVEDTFVLNYSGDSWQIGWTPDLPNGPFLALFDVDGTLHIGAVWNENAA